MLSYRLHGLFRWGVGRSSPAVQTHPPGFRRNHQGLFRKTKLLRDGFHLQPDRRVSGFSLARWLSVRRQLGMTHKTTCLRHFHTGSS